MADYLVASQDLTTPITHQQPATVFKAGFPVRVITVLSLPSAAQGLAYLIVGANQKPIKLTQQLQRIEIVGEPETEGVFVSCPAGVAATLDLVAGLELVGETRKKNSIDVRP